MNVQFAIANIVEPLRLDLMVTLRPCERFPGSILASSLTVAPLRIERDLQRRSAGADDNATLITSTLLGATVRAKRATAGFASNAITLSA